MPKRSSLSHWINALLNTTLLLLTFGLPGPAAAQAAGGDPVPNPAAEAYILETLATGNTVLLDKAFPDPKDRVIRGEFLVSLLKSEAEHPHPWVTLKDMVVTGDVIAYNLTLPLDLFFYKFTFTGAVNLGSSHFQRLRISDTLFEQYVYFDQAVVEKNLELDHDIFGQGVYFKGASVGADLLMSGCQILGLERAPLATYATYPSEFWQMKVGRSAVFDGTFFQGETTFLRSAFVSASFAGAQFGGKATFSRLHTESDTSFAGAIFKNEAWFDQTAFGETSFKDAQFQGPTTFEELAVNGNLDLTGAIWDLAEKPANLARLNVSKALRLENILAPGGLDLHEGTFNDLYLSAASAAPIPSLNLTQVEVARQLVIRSLQVQAFSADGLVNHGTLTMQSIGINQALDLRNSRLDLLVIKNLAWPKNPLAFNMRGMTYTDIDIGDQGLTEVTWRGLLQIIDQSAYSPQAYQTLAEFLANKGHPDWAQEARLAMKRRERNNALAPFSAAWLWSWFLEIFAGYGYRPGLAFLWSALVVAGGAWVFRKETDMLPVDQETVKLRYYPVLYSFALFLPYIDLGIAGKWEPNPQHRGASLYKHLHQILGWILMPIALLAFGGVLG
jgi:hypothetical protein